MVNNERRPMLQDRLIPRSNIQSFFPFPDTSQLAHIPSFKSSLYAQESNIAAPRWQKLYMCVQSAASEHNIAPLISGLYNLGTFRVTPFPEVPEQKFHST